jgi:hypothetical protein
MYGQSYGLRHPAAQQLQPGGCGPAEIFRVAADHCGTFHRPGQQCLVAKSAGSPPPPPPLRPPQHTHTHTTSIDSAERLRNALHLVTFHLHQVVNVTWPLSERRCVKEGWGGGGKFDFLRTI